MANIIQAEIVGVREAENTHIGLVNNTTYNSTFYSVLLFYDDGSRKLIEGDASQVSPYLCYINPHYDTDSIDMILKNHEKRIKGDIQTVIHQEVLNIFESIYPIPNVINRIETEAMNMLADAGFKVEVLGDYPPDIPPGIIDECCRKKDAFTTVQIRVRHDLPDLAGLSYEQVVEKLNAMGFNLMFKEVKTFLQEDNHLISIDRDGESMNVNIVVGRNVSTLNGYSLEDAEEVLKHSGIYKTYFDWELSDTIPIGHIVRTELKEDNGIVLFISKGKTNNSCKNNDMIISFDKFEDSTGGYIKGTATFDNEKLQLEIDLVINQYVKHRHVFENNLDCFVNDKAVSYSFPSQYYITEQYICPEKAEMNLRIILECNNSILNNNLPEKASINLYTSFGGLIKKNDRLFIGIKFNWEKSV